MAGHTERKTEQTEETDCKPNGRRQVGRKSNNWYAHLDTGGYLQIPNLARANSLKLLLRLHAM